MRKPKCRSCGKEHYGVCDYGGSPHGNVEASDRVEKAERRPASDDRRPNGARSNAGVGKLPRKELASDQAGDKSINEGRKGKGTDLPKPKRHLAQEGAFDRLTYQREYMRDKAIIKRLGLNCTVAVYRAGTYAKPSL